MLSEAVGAFLDGLTEREFDAPFVALLRAHGYSDIHFLHGSFEFGKDFIAKRTDDSGAQQYCFQTKAGDIGASAWREIRGQIDDMRTTVAAHPSFDAEMPRRVVLVTTGRLVGQAAVSAQQYADYVGRQHREAFEVWDREDLVTDFLERLEAGSAGSTDVVLLSLLSRVDQAAIQIYEIERFTSRWVPNDAVPERMHRPALEAAIVANRLAKAGRPDLACFVGLGLMRAAWATWHGSEAPPAIATSTANLGRRLFAYYAIGIWKVCGPQVLDAFSLYIAGEGSGFGVQYHARCCRLSEILALLSLLLREEDAATADAILDYLRTFVVQQPGAAHPISDAWAVSLIPVAVLLVRQHNGVVEQFLRAAVRWVADHYDHESPGLAPVGVDPRVEVDYLLGGPLESVVLQRRSSSYAATVLLDLASAFEFPSVYDAAVNDFDVVNARPEIRLLVDTVGQYVADADDIVMETHPPFRQSWSPSTGWEHAPHHQSHAGPFYLDRIGRSWDLLAIASLLRDRHFLTSIRILTGRR